MNRPQNKETILSSIKTFFEVIWLLCKVLGGGSWKVKVLFLVGPALVGIFFYEELISAKVLAYSLSAATSLVALVGLAHGVFALISSRSNANAEEQNAASLSLVIGGAAMLVALVVNGAMYFFNLF